MDPYKVTAKGGRQGHKVKKDESILNQKKNKARNTHVSIKHGRRQKIQIQCYQVYTPINRPSKRR